MSRQPRDGGGHTNPFRQSIIARSESPFDPHGGMTHFSNSSAPSLSSHRPSTNPFGDLLEPEFDLDDCEDEDLVAEEPPSYNEIVREPKHVQEKPASSSSRPPHERSSSGNRERRRPSAPGGSDRSGDRPSRSEQERLEREHRRLIEREKYYRERRKELERRQNATPEEEQRAKERRRRRREAKAAQAAAAGSADSKGSTSTSGRSRSKSDSVVKLDKKGRPLDTIDKMDVTGLFGPGAFHHDGPFDACNPHRNKKNNPRPPVAAFNIEGPNFSLIPGDVNEGRIRQEANVFGREFDQDDDTPKEPQPVVHGSLTMGLGTSTFMDGMPASKDAIQEATRKDRPTRSSSRRYQPTPDAGPSSSSPSEQRGLLGRVRSLRRPN